MKTRIKAIHSARSIAARILIPALTTAIAPLCTLPAGAQTQDTGAFKAEISHAPVTTLPAYTVEEQQSTKTHTLFMGAEIAINLDKDMYPVKDVLGSNWVIDINGRDREVSAKEAPVKVKITPTLKLTEVSATIQGFKKFQTYSFANDPSTRLTKSLTQAGVTNVMLQGVAQDAQNLAQTASNRALGGAAILAGADNQFGSAALEYTAQTAPAATHPPPAVPGLIGYPPNPLASSTLGDGQQVVIDMANQASAAADSNLATSDEATERITTPGLDALDVEFDIRSAKTLQDPYVVTMTRFRRPGAKPGMVQNMVYAKSLHPIDVHVSHVHFAQEGFPFGFEVVDFQLHLYNRGEEIATNVSSDRVELTRDEAFEYVKMEYVGSHKDATLPAEPAMGKLPAELPSKLAQGQYKQAFYVKVSKDGLADEAYSDPACTRRIDDPYLDSVVKRIRFKPALNRGTPVDGFATLDLGKLAI
jgi:hypothetical protein